MKAINYWEQFMMTGKIDDFLAYRNRADEEQSKDCTDRKNAGEHSHAGAYRDYGNGFKG